MPIDEAYWRICINVARTVPTLIMSFCTTCGKQMPCSTHQPGKRGKRQTARSRNWAQQRQQALGNPTPRGSNAVSIPPVRRTNWVMHGPNVKVKRFSGTVSCSKNVVIKTPIKGTYYSANLKDCLKILGDTDAIVFSIVIRFCVDHSSGVFGIIDNYSTLNPTAPNALSRRKFVKGEAMGIQLLAPAGCKISDVNPDTCLVFKYDNEFEAQTVIWMRDLYIQHSQPPRVEIPDDILYAESLPAREGNQKWLHPGWTGKCAVCGFVPGYCVDQYIFRCKCGTLYYA